MCIYPSSHGHYFQVWIPSQDSVAQLYASQGALLPAGLVFITLRIFLSPRLDCSLPEGRTLIYCIPNQTALNNKDVIGS